MAGVIGWSTKLEYTTAPTPGSYTAISEAVTIQLPGAEVTSVEDTHLSVTNKIRTFTPGLRDNGSISCTTNYSKATMAAVEALVGLVKTWKITAPDEDGAGAETAPTFTFVGFITKREPVEAKADEKMEMSFDIKISGAVTVA